MNRLAVTGTVAIGSLTAGACFMYRLNRLSLTTVSLTSAGAGFMLGAYALYQWSQNQNKAIIREERGIEKLYYKHENFFSLRTNWEQVSEIGCGVSSHSRCILLSRY
jgi:hypothetical protein